MENKTKIKFEIRNCRDCPFVKIDKVYTADSFEDVSKWTCTKKNGKQISGDVDWHEASKIPVPEWCPIKI